MSKLTIGFATYKDYNGAAFTLQTLRANNAESMKDVEFLVVDQTPPQHEEAKMLRDLVNHIHAGGTRARYVTMEMPKGTSQSRNKVIEEAQTEHAWCMDSHLVVFAGSVASYLDYAERDMQEFELVQGVLMLDDYNNYHTHMEPIWREEMFGIWGMMWKCSKCDQSFVVIPGYADGHSLSLFHRSPMVTPNRHMDTMQPFAKCECGLQMPKIPYERHETKLEELGFYRPGKSPADEPFEIPAHGLWLFGCRRDEWKEIGGFNREFRGFGGEEGYIHEKFRKAGGRTILHPGIRAWHRFGRPGGAPYNLAQLDKVRNYILGWRELGWNEEEVWLHFGEKIKNKMIRSQFNSVQNMVNKGHYPSGGFTVRSAPRPQEQRGKRHPLQDANLDQLFEYALTHPRDLDKHLSTLKYFAGKCKHVTEMSTRKESTIALLAAKPDRVVSYNTEEEDSFYKRYHDAVNREDDPASRTFTSFKKDSLEVDPDKFEETDLLFLDPSGHNCSRLRTELELFLPKVRRFLAIHDTVLFGEKGDDGKEGLNYALRELNWNHPEWRPVHFSPEQFGLTILSKNPEDYPSQIIQAWEKGFGPGTEMKKILSSLGINPSPTCSCNQRARDMDNWGVQGCRDNFSTIVGWIRDNAAKWGWHDPLHKEAKAQEEQEHKMSTMDKAKVISKAITTGLVFRINPSDPFTSLVEESIRRAEKVEKEMAKKVKPAKAPKKGKKWIEKGK